MEPLRRVDEAPGGAAPSASPSEEAGVDALREQHILATLRESEERFRCAFDHAAIGMGIVTPAGQFVRANPSLCAFLGRTEAELKTMDFQAITHPDDLEPNMTLLRRLIRGEIPSFQIEKRYVRKDGQLIWGLLSVSLYRDPAGRPFQFISQVQDISERKRVEHALMAAHDDMERRVALRTEELQHANEGLRVEVRERQLVEEALRRSQEQLVQSQKLQAIGQLAGGIAHEFNNLLTVIGGYVSLLERGFDASDPRLADLRRVGESADRAAALTRQLLAFGRHQVLTPQVVDLNALIAHQRQALSRLIGETIRIEITPAPSLGAVRVDPVHVEQVLLNLVLNGRDAMPGGGVLSIATDNVEIGPASAGDWSDVPHGSYAAMRVSDTGVGMAPEVQSRVFEPFFTTKDVGKGTGLGLSTVYGIVAQSRGFVRVSSGLGRGSTFTILLPRIDPIEASRAPADVAPARPAGSETLLLVEDEAELRRLARSVLQDAGYDVLEAGSGEVALDVSAGHAGPLHLLVTDVVMPGLTGPALVSRLRTERPELRVLYTSGYPIDAESLGLCPRSDFLQKPFKPDTLLNSVRSLLDRLVEG